MQSKLQKGKKSTNFGKTFLQEEEEEGEEKKSNFKSLGSLAKISAASNEEIV